jgi:flagellar M-ring protein FliF
VERARFFWSSRSSKQKIYLGVGLAITLATLAVLVQLTMTPDYKTLMTGLEAADAQAMTTQLAAKKIPFTISPDGTSISVPADQLDAARLEVASHDAPHSGRIGYEIFDKVAWGQTEFDEKVNFQRALEGELERTIQTMSNVKSARVHLVMATDSVFLDREREAKASVTLRLKRGSLSREQLDSIGRLVSGAVDNLKPSNVSIVDADSNKSFEVGGGTNAQTDSMERELQNRLIATLAPVVGIDHLHASVNVEYETGSSEENQEKYDPGVSTPLNVQRSEENSTDGGVAPGGVVGTSSNVPGNKPGVTAPAANTNPSQSSKSETATYGVNKITKHIVEPAGRIRRVTAAVLLDDAVERKQEKGKWVEVRTKRDPQQIKLISSLAEAAIGFDGPRGDVVSVQNLTFARDTESDAAPLTAVERFGEKVKPYSGMLRYCGIGVLFFLVYLLMIRPLQKKALASVPLLQEPLAVAAEPLEEVPTFPEVTPQVALQANELKKELAAFVQADPENSTTAVRAWLREN